jgi:hypothetical protein
MVKTRRMANHAKKVGFSGKVYEMGVGGGGYSSYEDEIYQGVLFGMFVIVTSARPFRVCMKLAVQDAWLITKQSLEVMNTLLVFIKWLLGGTLAVSPFCFYYLFVLNN